MAEIQRACSVRSRCLCTWKLSHNCELGKSTEACLHGVICVTMFSCLPLLHEMPPSPPPNLILEDEVQCALEDGGSYPYWYPPTYKATLPVICSPFIPRDFRISGRQSTVCSPNALLFIYIYINNFFLFDPTLIPHQYSIGLSRTPIPHFLI